MSDHGLRRLFEQLTTWRNFAAYKLESRIDVMFGLFLPQILGALDKAQTDIHPEVIPEFPFPQRLRPDGGQNTLRSDRIDFAAYCRAQNVLYLVELKTDMESVRDAQLDRMAQVCSADNVGVAWLNTIVEIAKPDSSDQTGKYLHLIQVLHKWGLVGSPKGAASKQWADTGRHGLTAELDALKTSCDNQLTNSLSLQPVLIKPQAEEEQPGEGEHFIVAEFRDVAQVLDKESDPDAALFAEFLRKWDQNPAGSAPPSA